MEELIPKLANNGYTPVRAADFDREQQVRRRLGYATLDRVRSILELVLRVDGNFEGSVIRAHEAPFHSDERVAQPVLAVLPRWPDKEPPGFILELDAIAQAIVEVEVRKAARLLERVLACVTAVLISQRLLPGVSGSSVSIGGPPWAPTRAAVPSTSANSTAALAGLAWTPTKDNTAEEALRRARSTTRLALTAEAPCVERVVNHYPVPQHFVVVTEVV